jgi:hypothetical protein
VKTINQGDGALVVAKMTPNLKVTFALFDDNGDINENSTYLDVWVNMKEIPEAALPRLFREALERDRKTRRSPSDSLKSGTDVAAQGKTEIAVAAIETTIERAAAPTTPLKVGSSSVPVNKPSPVKHTVRGSANLGKSGAKKLKLKYDFDLNKISFMEDAEDFPEM